MDLRVEDYYMEIWKSWLMSNTPYNEKELFY